ncbi:MAG: hypothetical protein JWP44_5172 [Mucilaginibacter sp.]|nr:hypothetical protein [Mucilaginibacter sp.]
MNASTETDLQAPRQVGQIVDLAVICHRRHPLLFLGLALSVVAPYTLIVLAATGSTPLGESNASAQTIFILSMVGFALVGPLVSVLHIHALSLLGEGAAPRFVSVYRRALPVLAVAAAAQIVAGFAIFVGLLAFVIPGLMLLIRLAVVAQVAAIERTDWIGALRRSMELTRGLWRHVFGAVVIAGIFEFALNQAGVAIAGSHTHVQQVALAIVVGTVGQSFSALIGAILYFDLRARTGS